MVADRPGAVELPRGPLSVELDQVSFRYPAAEEVSLASLEQVSTLGPAAGRPADPGEERPRQEGPPEDNGLADGMDEVAADLVLDRVSLTVPAGRMVALVGPSGAGKTTITALVARLYDPTGGAVRIGGQDVRDTTQASLHSAVGVVTQEAHLFHDTVRANLLYAKPEATTEELIQALRDAQVWDLVSSLPDGLDTVVGDRGHRLSGGEKQRIALARLLLKAPGVVILDEATAHLDSESELAVQRALDRALHGRTALVIAHRLSTVRSADLIVVVESGRIVELGRHRDLLARGGLYADLYTTQFADQDSDERIAPPSTRSTEPVT
jgi:ATP-binding cassette subfamily B protein